MCLAGPGQLISIDETLQDEGELPADALLRRMGKVSFGGILKCVSLAYVPEAIVGDGVEGQSSHIDRGDLGRCDRLFGGR